MNKEIKTKEYEHLLETDNWFNYAPFYEWIVKENPQFKTFAEVGVWKGHSIAYLASKLKEREDVQLYAIDLWEETYKYDGINHGTIELAKQKKFLYEIYQTNVERAGVRDIIKDYKECSWEAASNFEDESLDFVFIDAGHEYDEVTKDIEAWLPKVKPTGIISGHDYHEMDGNKVKKAVDDKFSKLTNKLYSWGPCWCVYKQDVNEKI